MHSCCFALLLAGLPHLSASIKPWWVSQGAPKRLRTLEPPLGPSTPGQVAKWFCQQKQDHFDGRNEVTWCQRYFVNSTYWKKCNGPVFVCVGGEGPAFEDEVLYRSIHCNDMVELAPQVGALMFAVEHRFYGHSSPNVSDLSTANLNRFLSSRQAAADLAAFHAYASAEYGIRGAKWVTFGGSYPGMLSSYARLLYPELFHAAVASSAPVQVQLEFRGYLDVVASALSVQSYGVGGSAACLAAVAQGHALLGARIRAGASSRRALERQFDLCGDQPLEDERNVAVWVGFGTIPVDAQDNNPNCTAPLCNIRKTCDALLAATAGGADSVDALAQVARIDQKECKDISYGDMLVEMKKLDLTNWNRVWEFQTCNEFAFYQTCEIGSNCPFTQGYNTLSFQVDQCSEFFGISAAQVAKNVESTIKFYGADKPRSTRVLWVNGQIDPWHYLSVLVPPGPESPTVWVPGDSHHFWTHPAAPTNSEYDIAARQAIWNYVKSWLHLPAGSASLVTGSFLGRAAVTGTVAAFEESALWQSHLELRSGGSCSSRPPADNATLLEAL